MVINPGKCHVCGIAKFLNRFYVQKHTLKFLKKLGEITENK